MTCRKTLRIKWISWLVASLCLCPLQPDCRSGRFRNKCGPGRARPGRVQPRRSADPRPTTASSATGPTRTVARPTCGSTSATEALKAEAFVPGKPDESELVARIQSTDPDELMPPPKSNKKLDARQKEILKRWIEQGAEYQQHWSYEKPVKAQIPAGAERR